MYNIFGQRYHAYAAFLDHKTGEVIDDGQPKQIKLGSWEDEKLAKGMAENIKANVPKRSWKIFVKYLNKY